jgi:hypothetical protein
MSKEEINLHIPREKQNSVMIDLLIENLAATFTLQDFVFMKLMNMSGDNMEQIGSKLEGFLSSQKKQIEQFQTEITASIMSKYSE